MTGRRDDRALQRFLAAKATQNLDATGATRSWFHPVAPQTGGVHIARFARRNEI